MNRKYIVRLSDEERSVCQEIVNILKGSSQLTPTGRGWTDVRIAEAFNCREQTIENILKRLVSEGFELALKGRNVSLMRSVTKR